MDNIEQNEIYERIIKNMIDVTREEMLRNDEMYLSLEERRTRLENEYLKDEKHKAAMNLVKEYIDIIQETDMRFADVSYMAAVKDTLSLMAALGFFDDRGQC